MEARGVEVGEGGAGGGEKKGELGAGEKDRVEALARDECLGEGGKGGVLLRGGGGGVDEVEVGGCLLYTSRCV